MRRITVLLAAALLATALPAPSVAADGTRTVTKAYTISRGQLQVNPQEVAWMGTQPESFLVRAGERAVTLSLNDDTGNPVLGRVEIDGDVIRFCSETEEPIRVRRGQIVRVNVIVGPCNGGFSVATEGTIEATFSR